MATSKKFNKEDFRRLMKERKEGSNQEKKKEKIDSPLAQYDSDGKLSCIVCQMVIISETSWTSHIIGKTHRDKLELLKRRKQQTQSQEQLKQQAKSSVHQFKKPVIPTLSSNNDSHSKNSLKRKMTNSSNCKPENSQSGVSSIKTARLENEQNFSKYENEVSMEDLDDGDSDSDSEDIQENEIEIEASDASNLPSDFFDDPSKVKKKWNETTEQEMSLQSSSQNNEIPKGFFDDPMLDAKARHVVYKDPMDEEWDKFEREMAVEKTTSQSMIEEDNEEIQVDRTIEEIEEQMHNWEKVDLLQKKIEVVVQQKTIDSQSTIKSKEDSDSDVDDEEMNVFANWRNKRAIDKRRDKKT